MKKATSVDNYIEQNSHYQTELEILRQLLLQTKLEEQLKWSAPVYSINNKNVLGIGAFKNHFCLWFFNGVFLKDEAKALYNAQEDKTKALRQLRFKTKDDINIDLIKDYVNEAIKNQELGKEIKPARTTKKVLMPLELKKALELDAKLNTAFKKLSLSKQNEYCEHITSAKREATKQSRIEKIRPLILNGAGLNDKYKNC
jgi:uncharacterized protein YdeI (YjbR/CyaY-like superfamily)